MVLLFHGGSGNPNIVETRTGFIEKAYKEGFIVVVPSGVHKTPNGGVISYWNWQGKAEAVPLEFLKEVDDINFVGQLLAKATREFSVDKHRIYATGFSLGAQFVQFLACKFSDKIAAIAAVSGHPDFSFCSTSRPIPAILFHEAPKDANLFPTPWAKVNQCVPLPEVVRFTDKKLKAVVVSKATYVRCKNNAEVIIYQLGGADHSWPGGKVGPFDSQNPKISSNPATNLIWEFFKKHPMR